MKNKYTNFLNATVLLSGLLTGGLVIADSDDRKQAAPEPFDIPEFVKIESLVYAGTGCPAGTVVDELADDKQAFTLMFDDFVAEVGPGIPTREGRKFCQINLDLSYTPGWSFAIMELDTRGYVGLDKKVTATQKSSFYFQGSETMGEFQTDFTGYFDDDYEVIDVVPFDAAIWSPCDSNRSLNIKTQVRLNNRRNRNGSGIITADSVDGTMSLMYGIAWKQCPTD